MPISSSAEEPLQLTKALAAAGDAAYCWNLDTDRIEWSGGLAATRIDLGGELATGRAFAARIHPDDLVNRQLALAAHCDGEAAFDCEFRLRAAPGGFVWLHERGQVVRGRNDRARQMFGVIRVVSDRRAAQNRLEQLANYDELTGHFNRTRLREAVDRIISSNQRKKTPAAFLTVGVDHMTVINDAFGHDAADTVLIEVGRRLDECLRVSDLVGRLGGDRFGIVLAHCPSGSVAVAAEKILAAIKGGPIPTSRGAVAATVSVGGASFPEHGLTSYDVITRAEAALAEAKRAGRDCYVHYRLPEGEREQRQRSFAIGEEVRAALREGRLLFAFQPVLSAVTAEVDYYECLLRLRDGDGEIVTAGAFVPVVEQLGLIRLIDRFVLDQTIEELIAHPGIRLGLNVSGLTAADRPWLRALASALRRRPDLAPRLVVEITETAALYDIEEAVRFVGALRSAGCRVALDDFGAGHTSLRHLHSLAVDTVKIDGAFVRNLAASAESQVFLRHLLGLARGFGFDTIAEGVESEAEAEILRREGVGFLQGYHHGQPALERPWLSTPLAPKFAAADE